MRRCKFLVMAFAVVLLSWAMTQGVFAKVATPYPNREAAEQAELAKLKEQGVGIGTYPITISYEANGKVVEETVLLTISGEHTVIVDNMAIDANDITISRDQVAGMQAADWIAAAHAVAWDIQTQQQVMVTSVNSSQVKSVLGVYPLFFAVDAGLQTQVQVHVVEPSVIANYFQTNHTGGWSEELYINEGLSSSFWTNFMYFFLEMLMLLILIIPLIILVVQYFVTSKMVRQVIHITTR
ncbi:hypothetical protein [Culicoidibacter larvae]|uniref:PepSY domain-containing protein n=1 Tax=Culicoidibacter larvae TaxID=2579976 RepID=A0A5R8QA06_9FIRM|nr:hypothetical protein [Culicoidibacter larvae]TLG72687.1 hypothetical protein FEZ08_08210 [Culicoidibacter larvae]